MMRELPMAAGAAAAGTAPHRTRDVAVSVVFVGSGFVAFLVAAALLIAWGPGIAAPGGWAGRHALALVHVLALGFISSVAIGVLYHLAPLAFGRRVTAPALGVALWLVYDCGAALLITGFAANATGLIAAGGATLATAIAGVTVHLGGVAAGARRRYLPGVYQAVAAVALVCVAGLGTTLALMLHLGAGASFLTILGVKVLLAIGGWLGVLVVGVSYQLVPMFTPSTARPRFAKPVLALLVAGVLVAATACAAGAPAWLRVVCAAPYAAGVVLHCADVARLVAARRVSILSAVTAGQCTGALLLLCGTAQGLAAMAGASPWPQLAVSTALLGWAPALIAANGVRIVPFIIWQGLPRGIRPRTFAAAPASLGWTGTTAAVAGWIAITVAMSANSAVAARVSGVALAICAVAVAGIGATALRDARRLGRT